FGGVDAWGGAAGVFVRPAADGAGRRIDTRVTAKMKASARAARPATSAQTWSAEPESTDVVLASGVVSSACAEPGLGAGLGLRVGNRPAALPPGLRVGGGGETPGRPA